jgi:hypothetical protein
MVLAIQEKTGLQISIENHSLSVYYQDREMNIMFHDIQLINSLPPVLDLGKS